MHSLLMHCANKGCIVFTYVQNKHREHAHTRVCVRARIVNLHVRAHLAHYTVSVEMHRNSTGSRDKGSNY